MRGSEKQIEKLTSGLQKVNDRDGGNRAPSENGQQ